MPLIMIFGLMQTAKMNQNKDLFEIAHIDIIQDREELFILKKLNNIKKCN